MDRERMMSAQRFLMAGLMLCWLGGSVPAAIALSPEDEALRRRFEAIVEQEKAELLANTKKFQDALVIVEFILKVQVTSGGQQRPPTDRKHRVTGTMVRPAGLTICSASAADPGRNLPAAWQGRVKVSSSILSVKIVLNDGAEVEAKVVFKDPDVDLLFVQPKEAGRSYTHVILDPESVPGMLETAVSMDRLDMSTNRTPVISVGAVRGIIEGPPKYYVIHPASPGLPVFDENGHCFGLYLRRKNASGLPVGNAFVLPAEDIVDTMDQIPPERKKSPKPKEKPETKEKPPGPAAVEKAAPPAQPAKP